MNKFQTLIDTDAFVGWILDRDSHHSNAVETFSRLKTQNVSCTTTSLVVIETATILSHASGQELAKVFLREVIEQPSFPVIFVDEAIYQKSLDIFKEQTRRATSVADCANVAIMAKFEIPTIFSFDKVYTKDFHLETVEDLLH